MNQVQIQRAEEYEVPVTSLTHTSPDQRDMNFYQEVSQPYETPVKSLRNMDLDKPNVYHVLEAPAQVKKYIVYPRITIKYASRFYNNIP